MCSHTLCPFSIRIRRPYQERRERSLAAGGHAVVETGTIQSCGTQKVNSGTCLERILSHKLRITSSASIPAQLDPRLLDVGQRSAAIGKSLAPARASKVHQTRLICKERFTWN